MPEAFLGARGAPVEHVDVWMRNLQRAAATYGLSAQAMDAGAVCGSVHLESALLHARQAFARGDNMARTLWVEWVLCAAGVRQVDVAFKRVGIRPGTRVFAVLLLSEGDEITGGTGDAFLEKLGLERNDDVLVCSEDSLLRLGVGKVELAAVPRERWTDLALERVALLDLER
jgi:tRNA threonylcarbamoyladenosine modification (KEOPS) complex Cgi121 subunit